jgi:hypothetical protein
MKKRTTRRRKPGLPSMPCPFCEGTGLDPEFTRWTPIPNAEGAKCLVCGGAGVLRTPTLSGGGGDDPFSY